MPVLTVENLKTYYKIGNLTVKAVDDVSLTLEEGEAVGIVGESACGKSTFALSLLRLIKSRDAVLDGKILLDGQSLMEMPFKQFRHIRQKEIALVHQAAMGGLNPVHSIGGQIVEAIRTHMDISKKEAYARAGELLELVGMDPERVKSYPHELSGGMRQRAMIAMGLSCDPKVLIADEITTALDVVTQAQVLRLLKDLQKRLKLASIVVSHDPALLAQIVDRIVVMYAGRLAEVGPTAKIFDEPKHPYTRRLLDSIMHIEAGHKTLRGIPGRPPGLVYPPPGCRFHPRCEYAQSVCKEKVPELEKVGDKHYAACHLLSVINGEG